MNLETLKTKINQGEIDTILTVLPDVVGRLVGKRFTAPFFLKNIAGHGTHVCNYLLTANIEMDPLEGFQLANWEKGYGDFEIRPDFETLRVLPWQPSTALVICDCHHHNGKLVDEAPRTLLKRQVEAVRGKGWVCQIASELEFFLFNTNYHDAFTGDYRNLAPSSDYRIDYHTLQPAQDEPLFRSIRNMMLAADIPVESSKGEWGRGQHEV